MWDSQDWTNRGCQSVVMGVGKSDAEGGDTSDRFWKIISLVVVHFSLKLAFFLLKQVCLYSSVLLT